MVAGSCRVVLVGAGSTWWMQGSSMLQGDFLGPCFFSQPDLPSVRFFPCQPDLLSVRFLLSSFYNFATVIMVLPPNYCWDVILTLSYHTIIISTHFLPTLTHTQTVLHHSHSYLCLQHTLLYQTKGAPPLGLIFKLSLSYSGLIYMMHH